MGSTGTPGWSAGDGLPAPDGWSTGAVSWRPRATDAADGWAEPSAATTGDPAPPYGAGHAGPDAGSEPDLLGDLIDRPDPAERRRTRRGRTTDPAGARPHVRGPAGRQPHVRRGPAAARTEGRRDAITGDPAGDEPGPRTAPPTSRRVASVVAGVLVAAAAMLALREGTEPAREPAAAPPAPIATPNVYARAYLEEPPFDRLPGRTPIPEPAVSLDHRTVEGHLPAVGDRTPGPVTADLATRLVLGRYCRRPWSMELRVEPLTADWTRIRMRATRDSDRPVAMNVYLTWDRTAGTYRWTGAIAQLASCS